MSNIKQSEDNPPVLPTINQFQASPDSIQSPHLQAYLNVFEQLGISSKLKHVDWQSYNIKYQRKKKNEPFKIELYSQRKLQNIYELIVLIGSFTLQVKVISIDINSPCSKVGSFKEGAYGQIYFIPFLGEELAIKSFQFTKKGMPLEWINSKDMKIILKQYCIAQISSILECGPKMQKSFGFDLIVFNNRIQFPMEKCTTLNNFSDSQYHTLMDQISTLHSYQIVHCDLKPTNIMFSPSHNKAVLIDYGFSQILQQQTGYKALTAFKGTFEYTSIEMLDLFSKGDKQEYIDLYYNDLIGLQKVYSTFQTSQNILEPHNCHFEIESDQMSQILSSLGAHDEQYDFWTYYMFILFSFIVNYEQQNTLRFLQKDHGILIKKYGPQILQTISHFFPSQFLQKLVFNELRSLSYLDEYHNISKLIKMRSERVFGYKKEFESIAQSYYIFLKKSMNNLEIRQEDGILLLDSSEAYNNLLKKQFYKKLQDKNIYLSLLIDQLRFDKKNNSIQQKNKLSRTFLQFIGKQINDSSNLAQIQAVFKCLLSEHFLRPSSEWESQVCFNLILQALLTDTAIISQLQQKYNQFKHWRQKQFMEVFNQYEQYLTFNRHQSLRYFFTNQSIANRAKVMIKKGIMLLEGIITENYIHSSDPDTKIATQFILYTNTLANSFGQFDQQMLSKIQNIENIRIKRCLRKISFQYLLKQKERTLDSNVKRQYLQKIRAIFQYEPDMLYQNFGEKIYWSIIVCQDFYSYDQIDLCCKQLRQTLCCQDLYQTYAIHINDGNMFFKYINANENYVYETAKKLFNSCFQNNNFQFLNYSLQLSVQLQYQTYPKQTLEPLLKQFFTGLLIHFTQELKILKNHAKINDNYPFSERTIFITDKTIYEFYFIFKEIYNDFSNFQQIFQEKMAECYWKLLSTKAENNTLSPVACNFIKNYLGRFLPQMLTVDKINAPNNEQYFYEAFLLLKNLGAFLQTHSSTLMKSFVDQLIVFKTVLYNSKKEQHVKVRFIIKWIDSTLIWLWKYRKITGDIQSYFVHRRFTLKNTIIYQTMQVMLNHIESPNLIYQFIFAIVNFLGRKPLRNYIQRFGGTINKFAVNHLCFFDYETINSKIGPINWRNRYLLLLYPIFVFRASQLKNKLRIMAKIAKNIYMHTWSSRIFIEMAYYSNWILIYDKQDINPRKKLHIYMRSILNIYDESKSHYHHMFTVKDIIQRILHLAKLSRKSKKNNLRNLLVDKLKNLQISEIINQKKKIID